MEEGVPIEHGMVTRAIERAQKQVESQNFSVRKHPSMRRRDEQAAREHHALRQRVRGQIRCRTKTARKRRSTPRAK
jgi:preprotein translocase subunit SecA